MSFRTRLFATYALIIVVCLAIVAIATTAVLQGYRDRLTMDRLDNMARPISVQVRSLATAQTTLANLMLSLQQQAEKNNVYIILGNSDGQIVREITPTPSEAPVALSEGALPRNISKAVQGRFTTDDRRVFLYAAYPVGRLQAALALPTDTIFLAVPRAGSLAILAGLLGPLLLGGLIALAISLFVAIALARSVSRPLNRLTGAAEKIASGDYAQKIPEEGPRETKELARSFNHMTDEVRLSHQQLRHFVADVSHELKSPLTSIQGFSQALIDGTASDEATRTKAVTVINTESKRMRRQVDELLELSRMQSGQFKMAHESVDLGEVITNCRDLFGPQATDKGVKLIADVGGSLVVRGDADRLEQLFGNLLDNAIKNTQSGGQVSVAADRSMEGFVEARVTDNGPGIPQDQLTHVFERFYQVTGVRTGVGLGLAIAREIALAHGGMIEARSQPGEGAEFIVHLPAGS